MKDVREVASLNEARPQFSVFFDSAFRPGIVDPHLRWALTITPRAIKDAEALRSASFYFYFRLSLFVLFCQESFVARIALIDGNL